MQKFWLLLCLSILLSACSSFKLPPPAPSPVYIHIQGNTDVVSSMPLDPSTVTNVVATHVANGYAALRFSLTTKGAKALYNITSTSIGDKMHVYWQDNIISSTTIQSPLGGSRMGLVLVIPDNSPNEIQGIINSIKTSSTPSIEQG